MITAIFADALLDPATGMLTPTKIEGWDIVMDRLPKPNNIGS